MLCPVCDVEWPDSIRYCGDCGARMPDATLTLPSPLVQVEATAAPEQPPEPPTLELTAERPVDVSLPPLPPTTPPPRFVPVRGLQSIGPGMWSPARDDAPSVPPDC
jgi:hypothetical protein